MEIGSEKNRQVNTQINQANKSVDELSAIVEDLGKRLERVLRDPPPQDAEATPREEADLVPVASEIRDMASNIGNQAARLRDYLDRLEV